MSGRKKFGFSEEFVRLLIVRSFANNLTCHDGFTFAPLPML